MKGILVLVLFGIVLLAGCATQTPQAPAQPAVNNTTPQPVQPPINVGNSSAQQPNNISNGTVAPPPPAPIPQPTGKVAQSQADCAVLTPNCGACVAISGCGWCKGSNSCFFGNASGPEAGQCQPGDWATTQLACNGPTGGSVCASQTNCVSCLSGSSCKFCIQGAKCADASSTDSCFGGWLNVSYQCNYASR